MICHVVDAVVVAAVFTVTRPPPPSTILRFAVTRTVSAAVTVSALVSAPVARLVAIGDGSGDPDRFLSVLLLLLFSLIILWYDHRSCSD